MLDLYDDQKSRGQQGFGIFDGQEMNMVHESREEAILNWLCRYDSNLLLMHHRFPTSTVNVKRAAHPFSTKDYFGKTQYVLVHNGGISNAEELYEEHLALGIEYYSLLQDTTFNDSEALLWDFALYMEGKQDGLKARGGIAFICLKLVKGKLERMYFGRNYNPLNLYRSSDGIALSSEGPGESIKPDTLYNWNYKLKRLTKKPLTIPGYARVTSTYTSDNYDEYGNYGGQWNNRDKDYIYDGPYTRGSYASSRFGGDDWRDGLRQDDGTWDWEDLDSREGQNIGNILVRQFGSKFKKDKQLYLPVGRKTAQQQLLERKGNLPTEEEIQTEYMAYLAGSQGHFEQAYWAMEMDYEDLENQPDTLANIRKRVLLEKLIAHIQDDEEYVDQDSVSEIWRAIWHSV